MRRWSPPQTRVRPCRRGPRVTARAPQPRRRPPPLSISVRSASVASTPSVVVIAPSVRGEAHAQIPLRHEAADDGAYVFGAAGVGAGAGDISAPAGEAFAVAVAASGDAGLQTAQSASLIRLTNMRADPRFAGIDGSGFSVVVIDSGADLNHSAFGPDRNGDGIADRIKFQYDFSSFGDFKRQRHRRPRYTRCRHRRLAEPRVSRHGAGREPNHP